jgi:hypothetical protein
MSERKTSGRKRHIVEGEAVKVRRSQGLGTYQRVGEGGFMSVVRRLLRSSRNEEKK